MNAKIPLSQPPSDYVGSSLSALTSELRHSVLPHLPRPLGPRRPNSRLVFPVASAVLCAASLYLTAISPILRPRKASIAAERDFELAWIQSAGFFDDVPSSEWKDKRERAQSTPSHNDAGLGMRSEFVSRDRPAVWYQNNWDPTFTCPEERRVGAGGDGGKWVCDPHRIREAAERRMKTGSGGGNGCLAYTIGIGVEGGGVRAGKKKGTGEEMGTEAQKFDLNFELALLDELGGAGSCEIHVFDSRASDLSLLPSRLPKDIIFHPWSVEGEADRPLGRRDRLTLSETLQRLGHTGHTIDVFKVDCESCEWTQYRDWTNSDATLHQILVELHGSPHNDNRLFEDLRHQGYVVFHKEVDAQYGGMWVEFGFLRLHPEFFKK